QAALLADFRKQSRTHAAWRGEYVHRSKGGIIVGVANRHARIGNGDLRLFQVLGEIRSPRRLLAEAERAIGSSLPVPEQALDLIAQRLPFDAAGHGEDGAIRLEPSLMMPANSFAGNVGDALRVAAAIIA